MPRGVKTRPAIQERAIALFAKEASYSEVGRQLGIARQTATDLISNGVEFSEFRQQVEQHYIVSAWHSIQLAHDELQARLKDKEALGKLSIPEVSRIIAELHKTVTNVAQHVMAIQVNVNTDSDEDIESAAFDYVAQIAGLSVAQVKEKLNIA